MRRMLNPRREALRVLEKHHRTHRLPVDIEAIAGEYATVAKRPLDRDVSAVLAPLEGGKWLILVNEEHVEVRQRFSIAHELGHLLLHAYTAPHADRAFRFRDARSSEGSALEEIQANRFAAELLMPADQVLSALRTQQLDHAPETPEEDRTLQDVATNLAGRLKVSTQAMTIRISTLIG